MASVKTTEVNAILSEEFDQLLEVLGIGDQLKHGAFRCESCLGPITRDNVMAIFPLPERKVGFLCAKLECSVDYAAVS